MSSTQPADGAAAAPSASDNSLPAPPREYWQPQAFTTLEEDDKRLDKLDGFTLVHMTNRMGAVGARLGKGSHGVVYSCIKDTEPDKLVAMKVMRKDAEYNTLPVESETIRYLANREHLYPGWEHTARMITEFRRLSDDVFVTWAIALEYCDTNLDSLSNFNSPWLYENTGSFGLPVPLTKIIMSGILKGLDFLSSCGVVHRDIKPDNVLINYWPPMAKLTDFGLSTRVDQQIVTYYDTLAHCGHIAYRPPEVVRRFGQRSPVVDIWGAGRCLAYMITGFHLSFARNETDDWFDSLDGWMTLSPGFKFTVRRMAPDSWPVAGEFDLLFGFETPENRGAIHLLRDLLQFRPDCRISPAWALGYGFVKDAAEHEDAAWRWLRSMLMNRPPPRMQDEGWKQWLNISPRR
ncbi:MAPK protein hog1 [Saitozyma podzolica]|uniref:MAPK protein hog1 n=1 Tax=Saitozyma podzolica TaxID=1890683 RepID=A0A427YTU2_9TREE|nr:MAPK protein hog1 [Saitozyma podzolica]